MTYPFDIDEARRIHSGESDSVIVTYRGDRAIIVQIDDDGDFPVMCIIIYGNGSQRVQRYTLKGKIRPITRSADDIFIYSEKKIDKGVIPYSRELEAEHISDIIDEDRNKVRITHRSIYRSDLVNADTKDNMLCLSETKNGTVPFVCDSTGMRDGNQVLFIKTKKD